jgi:hypothetical protein
MDISQTWCRFPAVLFWLQVDMEYLKNLALHPCCVALRAG